MRYLKMRTYETGKISNNPPLFIVGGLSITGLFYKTRENGAGIPSRKG